MTKRKLVISYKREGGSDCSVESKDLASFLKDAEFFLKNGYEFRTILRQKDTEAQTELRKVFEKHAGKYTIDNPNSVAREAAKGAAIGAEEVVINTALVVGGLTVLEVAMEGLGDFADILGEHVTSTVLESALEHAADGLHYAADATSHAIDTAISTAFPIGLMVKIGVKAFTYGLRAHRQRENALTIITFTKEKNIVAAKPETEKSKLLPALNPVPATVLL